MLNIKYKYYLVFPKKKYKIISKNNNLRILLKEGKEKIFKNKDKYVDLKVVLLKLTKQKIVKNESKIKLYTGPIKVEMFNYKITKRGTIKLNEKSKSNLLFYTDKYLEKNKIKSKDLMKIGKAFDLDKLEKRLLAPKLINQISKISL